MIEPEISRRCSVCGASIRERAFFCPQCGKQVELGLQTGSPLTQPLIEQPNSVAEKPTETLLEAAQSATDAEEPQHTPVTKTPGGHRSNHPRRKRPGMRPTTVKNGYVLAVDRGHRATAAAREVIEDNLLPRVEKLRKVSSVVIDQAAYDPSLRFVLVAAVLFLIFLVILVLNELV